MYQATTSSSDHRATLETVQSWSSLTLRKGDFDALESEILSARNQNERVLGGFQKLYAIFSGLAEPNVEENESDSEWSSHFSRLERWKAEKPDSIAPRIALAESYLIFAYNARGPAVAKKVSQESWRLFHERTEKAKVEISEAVKSGEKCPQMYSVLLAVGRAEGWSRNEFDRVYELGLALEPTYINLHRQKLKYLLPQWYGRPGDIKTFLNEIAGRIQGDEGEILQYALYGAMMPEYRGQLVKELPIEWYKLKAGYEKLRSAYGVDRFRLNQFAYLASVNYDAQAALSTFHEIGPDRDESVFYTHEDFVQHRTTAETLTEFQRNGTPLPPGHTPTPAAAP